MPMSEAERHSKFGPIRLDHHGRRNKRLPITAAFGLCCGHRVPTCRQPDASIDTIQAATVNAVFNDTSPNHCTDKARACGC